MKKRKLVLVLGSGFSCEAGIPSTKEIASKFLKTSTKAIFDTKITEILKAFWRDIFAYDGSGLPPSLEDHFTVIDLAANTGHQLGPNWPPKKLRAVRRMSIHRVFQILDSRYHESESIQRLLRELCGAFDLHVVSLNWDIVLEKHLASLSKRFTYGTDFETLSGPPLCRTGIPLFKMHGSSNWLYCDSCRRFYADTEFKGALHRRAYLEADDFRLLNCDKEIEKSLSELGKGRNCRHCGNRLTGRLATFSYRKFFALSRFQETWELALAALGKADTWLFIGYSMPEADFEFRHLLKSAQLARRKAKACTVYVVLKRDPDAEHRYRRFFGSAVRSVHQCGLESWATSRLEDLTQKGRKAGT